MEEELHFAPFSIVPARRSLMRGNSVVSLGSRATDILLYLIAHPGELKTNQEIVKHVWPDTFVDEANLRVHVSALRKALGDTKAEPHFIANIPGRGYTFIARVERRSSEMPTEQFQASPEFRDVDLVRVIGRDQTIEAILSQLEKGRLITVTGPGGIGKSTVAKVIGSRLSDKLKIVRVDLSEVASGELVPTVIASAIGVPSRSDSLIDAISKSLETVPSLVILDGCEHLIEDATRFVDTILQQTTLVRFLATSREPLRGNGERVHRLLPLELPVSLVGPEEALRFPAVQLFVERADACLGGYELTEEDVPLVIDICTRLDGIALAIELAAGRLESMGISSLGKSLDDCFKVLSRGRRTALPRHQTLRAALDWSYLLLTPSEQGALAALSVCRGRFTMGAAEALMAEDADDLVAALVAKSLLVVEAGPRGQLYRMLDTTRIYAAEKLSDLGRFDDTMSNFADYMRQLLDASSTTIYTHGTDEVVRDFSFLLPGLRACLDWALIGNGDNLLGSKITVAALPLYFKLSLFDECIASVTAAIGYLDANPDVDEASRMKLYTALGWPQLIAADAPGRGVEAWTASARIAEKLGDVDHQLRSIWGLWVDAVNRAEPTSALGLTVRFAEMAVASPDPADILIGQRMKGATLHWLGRHMEARSILTGMLAEYDDLPSAGHAIRFQFDQRVTAQIVLARCKWFIGHEQEAMTDVASMLDYADGIRHYASLTNALAEAACPLALMSGDDELAAHYVAMLRQHTKAMLLDIWRTYADCFEAELVRRAGDNQSGLRQLRRGLQSLRNAGFVLFESMFATFEARALCGLGRNAEAISVLDASVRKCRTSGEAWWLPELYRAKANVQMKISDVANARVNFESARRAAKDTDAIGLLKLVEADMAGAGLDIAEESADFEVRSGVSIAG
ncbi:ATP-binding protein [Pararhizobium qamdonense]|uniref:ATP-binding protein n=1 Tax=Pararhizobium qamdonense TaxID=3031126 RepID=UPI0023E210F6|nr:winged helix-turn-helix domain-containing protein [Pararhizobium qamdonense]